MPSSPLPDRPAEAAGRRQAAPGTAAAARGVTVIVPLSGPHRLAWLEETLASVPLESPHVHRLHVIHQGGAWDWGGALRERLVATPKVRLFEFAQRVDFASSFNRALDTVETRWAMLLPDDDKLIPHAFARAIAALDDTLDVGYLAFGWYELNRGRYVYDHAQGIDPGRALRGPPFCSTLINVRHCRAIGGYDNRTGGFCDIVLYTQLRHRFGTRIADAPVGIMRIHQQQGGRQQENYAPFIDATRAAIAPCLPDARHHRQLERRLNDAVFNRGGLVSRARRLLAFLLSGSRLPRNRIDPADTARWLAD